MLNPDTDECDHTENVPICKKSKDQDKLYRSKEPFNCTSLSDGLYEAEPCSVKYIECASGHAWHKLCPSGLWFNPKKQVCDYSSKCRLVQVSRGQAQPTTDGDDLPPIPPGLRRKAIEYIFV